MAWLPSASASSKRLLAKRSQPRRSWAAARSRALIPPLRRNLVHAAIATSRSDDLHSTVSSACAEPARQAASTHRLTSSVQRLILTVSPHCVLEHQCRISDL